MNYKVFLIIISFLVVCYNNVFSQATQADFIQTNDARGLVVMPAESYSSYRSGLGEKEGDTFTLEDSTAGFFGDGYMRANMSAGDGSTENAENYNIKLSYNIKFNKTGTHYIWAYVYFPDPYSDSFFFGTDGKVVDQIAGSPRGEWNWHLGTTSFEIDTVGIHTLDIFGREPNSIIDHIIITTDYTFDPNEDDYSLTKKIAFVSLPDKKDENGDHPDQPFIDDLKAEGYEVNSVYSSSLETASAELLDTLNTADLIIIGRSVASSDFGDTHREAWNGLKTPIMLLQLFAARNNRLNWLPTATATAYNTAGDTISAKIEAPDDEVFADVVIAADSTMQWVVSPYDYMETTDGGNGTVLARETVSSNVLFVRWEPLVEFYEGAGTMPAGYRTLIGNGNDNANATNGDPFNYYNFSAAAKQVYLNEVARMLELPEPPDQEADLTIIFVAADGSDDNPGTMEEPLASLQKAQELADAGDTVYVRGGTYQFTDDDISQVVNGLFASVTYLGKSGTEDNTIKYWAYPGETPVFNFSNVKPQDKRVVGIYVAASYLHIKGIEMTGIQTTITGHTESYCIYSRGSNNIYENISMHDNKGTGLRHYEGGGNLFLNCDAYRNWDNVSEDGLGSNNDGFGCHPAVGATGNVFKGCRAWFNSDDGFDIIRADEAVVFDSCWAFYNGYSSSFQSLGDGNGFKAGGYAYDTEDKLPEIIPRNTIRFSIAVRNKANGFYANHHLGGNDWFNNSGYRNGAKDFNMLNRPTREDSENIDGPGYDHVLKNNLAVAQYGDGTAYIVDSLNTQEANTWNLGINVGSSDLVNTDMDQLTTARNADGSLPDIDFLKPVGSSAVVDAGVDIGFPYLDAAPDLGAFEVEKTVSIDTPFENLPSTITLYQNYPNPFNPETTIRFALPSTGFVQISIYNYLGQKIRTLVNQQMAAGVFNISWNGSNDNGKQVSSGIYFYKLSVKSASESYNLQKKMMLIR